MTLPCGATYIGGYENGYPDGIGMVTTPMKLREGQMYVGELKDGQPFGQGVMVYANLYKFEGTFDYLNRASVGVVRDAAGNQLNGYCTNVEYYNRGYYSCQFVQGKRHGFGIHVWPDGDIDEGDYVDDRQYGVVLRIPLRSEPTEMVVENSVKVSEKPAGPVEFIKAAMRRTSVTNELINQLQSENIRLNSELQTANTQLQQLNSKTCAYSQSFVSAATAGNTNNFSQNGFTKTYQSEADTLRQQFADQANEFRQQLTLVEQKNDEKVRKIQETSEQQIQQIKQNSSTITEYEALQQQLMMAQQTIQQNEVKHAKQEVEMMRQQMQMSSEINKLNEEIRKIEKENAKMEKELNKSQNDLAMSKSISVGDYKCKRCDAGFINPDGLANHITHCKKLPCPMCEMKFNDLGEFCTHTESHKK